MVRLRSGGEHLLYTSATSEVFTLPEHPKLVNGCDIMARVHSGRLPVCTDLQILGYWLAVQQQCIAVLTAFGWPLSAAAAFAAVVKQQLCFQHQLARFRAWWSPSETRCKAVLHVIFSVIQRVWCHQLLYARFICVILRSPAAQARATAGCARRCQAVRVQPAINDEQRPAALRVRALRRGAFSCDDASFHYILVMCSGRHLS